MRRWALVLMLAGFAASARELDGSLGLIRAPHNGAPAVVAPGSAFDAVLEEKAELSLEGPGAPDLAVTWTTLLDGRFRARCAVPEGARAGAFALSARSDKRVDRTVRAVYVRGSIPDAYVVAHVTDIHIGSDRNARSSEAIFRDVIAALNKARPALVLVTGDVTQSGTREQFATFLAILDSCLAPTFVTPGNHDRLERNYEDFFGATAYAFRFGRDGYLCFDTKDYRIADGLGRQDADLEVFRRAIKPARWSIGATHRYDEDMGMRSQMVLFVDDPLDHLLVGHTHRPKETTLAWGATKLTVTPAAINGFIRLFDVSERGIAARPHRKAAVTGGRAPRQQEAMP